MLLGSHNSWTFGKTQWWVPSFTCRCQSLNIKEQYEKGVRFFDLRLKYSKKGWQVAHGSAIFKVSFYSDLTFLDSQKDCYVRIILEYNSKPKDEEKIKQYFRSECNTLKTLYPDIKFCNGRMKYSWEVIYNFLYEEPELLDRYSSTTSLFNSNNKFLKIIDDWYPKLYAKLNNKKIIEDYKKNGPFDKWLFIDFVEIGIEG